MQGNQTKIDVRPPLAVLNYTLDKACLSYQGEHCSVEICCLDLDYYGQVIHECSSVT